MLSFLVTQFLRRITLPICLEHKSWIALRSINLGSVWLNISLMAASILVFNKTGKIIMKQLISFFSLLFHGRHLYSRNWLVFHIALVIRFLPYSLVAQFACLPDSLCIKQTWMKSIPPRHLPSAFQPHFECDVEVAVWSSCAVSSIYSLHLASPAVYKHKMHVLTAIYPPLPLI